MVKCNPCLGARPNQMNPTLVSQDDQAAWEELRRDSLELKKLKRQAKIAKSKAEKEKEIKVHSELLARDATKANVKSIDLVSKLKQQYGPQDSLNKPSVSVKKPSKKGASPAKRSRDEETHPVTAESPHHKSGHGQRGPPEMPPRQGSHPTKKTPKMPPRQGFSSNERAPNMPPWQGPKSDA